jgi:hypothetical protein
MARSGDGKQQSGSISVGFMTKDSLEKYQEETHWAHFGESYARLGSPLIPGEQDLAAFHRAVASWRQGYPKRRLRILVCGVTPALAGMSWPDESDLLGVDKSTGAIHALWRHPAGKRWPLCGDWLQLPLADKSCDIVAGDGSFNCMRYPEGYRALASAIDRVLRLRGLLLMRLFTRPEQPEEPAQVFADLHACRIPSFHHFKWRLVMALQTDVTRGVVVNNVFDAWVAAGICAEELSERTGWDLKVIETIELYKGKQTLLSFPTFAELQAVLAGCFDETSVYYPDYPLGERCPTLAFMRREI